MNFEQQIQATEVLRRDKAENAGVLAWCIDDMTSALLPQTDQQTESNQGAEPDERFFISVVVLSYLCIDVTPTRFCGKHHPY